MGYLSYSKELNIVICLIIVLRVMLFQRIDVKNCILTGLLMWMLTVACALEIYCLLLNNNELIVWPEAFINMALCMYLYQSGNEKIK